MIPRSYHSAICGRSDRVAWVRIHRVIDVGRRAALARSWRFLICGQPTVGVARVRIQGSSGYWCWKVSQWVPVRDARRFVAASCWSRTGVDVVAARFRWVCLVGRWKGSARFVGVSCLVFVCVHVFVVCVDCVRALFSDCQLWVSTGKKLMMRRGGEGYFPYIYLDANGWYLAVPKRRQLGVSTPNYNKTRSRYFS